MEITGESRQGAGRELGDDVAGVKERRKDVVRFSEQGVEEAPTRDQNTQGKLASRRPRGDRPEGRRGGGKWVEVRIHRDRRGLNWTRPTLPLPSALGRL